MGIVMVASTGLSAPVPQGTSNTSFIFKQSLFGALGLGGALALSAFDYHILRRWVVALWILCSFLLICCYLPGIGMTINGESRWVNLGFMSFQPSELAKITLMLALASWYTTYREMAGTFWCGFAIPGGVIFGIPLLLILMEKEPSRRSSVADKSNGRGLLVLYGRYYCMAKPLHKDRQ